MSIRQSKSNVEPKTPRWAFHHGAGRLRRAGSDEARSRPTNEAQQAQIVDAGDGGLVAPDLAGDLAPDRNHQPPPHDYSRASLKRGKLPAAQNMRDEDGAGGPVWLAVLGDNTSEAMRQFMGLVLAFIFLSAVFFWFLA
ncbi:hypothetical protein LAC81_28660 [Ensifer adhaerens]|uniref:hypothetical protein n=1 Tax=Ensifer adhaerens TaxID=106592 RepID=UPI001CBFDC86|nr:hypothetical protein [Ensifer adhaerens]MBZ7924711.1 hypothetical protein [Ensifer adhaerens]UAX96062.1 hypothetical protein LAC78_35170 [Ensifer adhaerens]UAY04597.1 hypothetical protein LAC80_25140 [Ensifer adhaerens]UAY10028.1 hypothetical protein LAC81_28660 [Ensifer adhaerens]